jgi:hypothetical protein
MGWSRRASLGAIAGAGTLTMQLAAAVDDKTVQAIPPTAEEWMLSWMSAARPIAGALHMARFKDPIYILLRPIKWFPGKNGPDLPSVEVPKGFVTDLTSVPRPFWSLLRPDGEYTYAAIIHDYLYWTQSTDRAIADSILWSAMQDFGIDNATAGAIFTAVRAGGSGPWETNKRARDSGEKRVLKRLPQDPRMTWDEWKTTPGVF